MKRLILVSMVIFLSGCSVISNNTNYIDIVEKASYINQFKSNNIGPGYTYYIPKNGKLVNTGNNSNIIEINNNLYNLTINITSYLEENQLIFKNSSGEYVKNSNTNKEDVTDDNNLYETSRIFLANNPSLSNEDNLKNANAVLKQLNDADNKENTFGDLALKNSDDVNTAGADGYVGFQTANEMETYYYEAAKTLKPNSYTTSLVKSANGYDIIYLHSISQEEENLETEELDENYIFSKNYQDITVNVAKQDQDLYYVEAKNNYSTSSVIVTNNFINEALYNVIILLNNVTINDEIATAYITNPIYATKSAEIIDLNNSNQNLESYLANQYEYDFNSTFDVTSKDNFEIGEDTVITFDTKEYIEEEEENPDK